MIDHHMERRVWQRVYDSKPSQRKAYTKAALEQCYRRELADAEFYDRHREDPTFGAAFAHLAAQAREHCKMLQIIMKG